MPHLHTTTTALPQHLPTGLVEYLATTPAARDGVRVTFTGEWSLHGRLTSTHRDGFTLAMPSGGAYFVLTAAVSAVEILKVRV